MSMIAGGQQLESPCVPDRFSVSPDVSSIHATACVAAVDAEGAFFAQTDGADRGFRHTERQEVLFNGLGPFETKNFIEAHGSLLIGVALDKNAPIRFVLQELGMFVKGGFAVVGESLPVDFKEDVVVKDIGTPNGYGEFWMWTVGTEAVSDDPSV